VKADFKSELTKMYPFKENYFSVGEHQIHYVDHYSGGEQPPRGTVVMVHGNPSWSFLYRNLILALANNYRCIAIDHLGCGLSDKPQDYHYCLENHISNLKGLINHLELDQLSIIVHDWGGAIGSGIVTSMPDKITSMTVLNSAAFPMDEIPWRINVLRTPFLGSLLIRWLNAFAWPASWMATDLPLSSLVRAGYLYPYRSAHDRIAIARFVEDIPMSSSHPSYPLLRKIEQRLHIIKPIPTQLVWGEDDFCFTNNFLARWMEILPHAQTHLLANCGHYVQEDGKEQLIPLVLDFLNSKSAAN
jgi:cis-3-alkyl-4-acyloxetan-2-one decarboxylase